MASPSVASTAGAARPASLRTERVQLTFDASLYSVTASTAAERQASAVQYASELATALDVAPSLLVLKEAQCKDGSGGGGGGGDGGGGGGGGNGGSGGSGTRTCLVLLELMAEGATSVDLGSLPPAAQLGRLRKLVLSATASTSPRALRATLEVSRLTPGGVFEPIATDSEVAASRRWAKLPVVLVIAIVGTLGLLCVFMKVGSNAMGNLVGSIVGDDEERRKRRKAARADGSASDGAADQAAAAFGTSSRTSGSPVGGAR